MTRPATDLHAVTMTAELPQVFFVSPPESRAHSTSTDLISIVHGKVVAQGPEA